MQEICTVTALGENALTSISYAKVALQMAETQNGCRKIGLGYSGAYKYMTNIEEEQFSFPCYGCKKEIQLFRGKDAYYTAGRDDTAE